MSGIAKARAARPSGSPGELVRHYEDCFVRHGRTPKGVDWPNADDLATRFEVMLGLLRAAPARPQLLDLGCGPGLLLDHLQATGRVGAVHYAGIDLSEPMLASARGHWPSHAFERRDILTEPLATRSFDYVLMNGVLTERRSLSQEQMVAFALDLLAAAFDAARVGIAFNVMSKLVDWERDDLFHWGFDEMSRCVSRRLSRHLLIRADYGLYEYTVYVFRDPHAARSPAWAPGGAA
jgi:SAM-dependent methyltransferase